MGNDAYAFVGVYQGKAVVKELGCMNREAYHTMLEHILSMYHEVEVIEPYMDSPSRAPFAQARIINVKSALSAATRANGQTFCIKAVSYTHLPPSSFQFVISPDYTFARS